MIDRHQWCALGAATLALALSACSPLVTDAVPLIDASPPVVLAAGASVGQSFTALHSGLAGFELYLAPDAAGDPPGDAGELRLRLQTHPPTGADLAASSVSLSTISRTGFYQFQFAPQPDSLRRDYYVLLEVNGSGQVQVGTAPGPFYDHGSAYRDGVAADQQLAFHLVYASGQWWRGIVVDAAAWLFWLGLFAFLFTVPGLALMVWLWPADSRLRWVEWLALATGIGVALCPAIFLWSDLAGMRLGLALAWLPPLAGLGGLGFLAWKRRAAFSALPFGARWRAWLGSELLWPDLALLGVVVLTFGVRFWAVRGLPLPMWGDSYQHALIAQLLAEYGGLFRTWQPYAGLSTFTYHFGFHSLATVFYWLSRLEMPQAVLWTGQILNGLSAVVLYPLAARLGRTPWAGVAAVLLVGLLSPVPMVYTNWGRYTQLAGQVILPAIIVVAGLFLERREHNPRLLLLLVVALLGLALTHYRVLLIAAAFMAAYFVAHIRRAHRLAPRGLLLGLAVGLLILPWLLRTTESRMAVTMTAQATTLPQARSLWGEMNTPGNLALYPAWIWLITAAGLAGALWRRDRPLLLMAGWWLLALVAANPQWFGLPGEGIVTNFLIFVAAYIPAGLLIGCAVGWLALRIPARLAPLLLVVMLAAGALGAQRRLADIRPAEHALGTWADLRAAAWIQAQLPPDARFLVNSFFAFNDRIAVGSDGGWWLPITAGRQSILPPINYALERGDVPDYFDWVAAPFRALQQQGVEDNDMWALLAERGVTHVYVGQKQGRVNYNGPPALDPQRLLDSGRVLPVYHQDRVWIFEIIK